jgi:prepilin-type N-terminal cleavage/methylation domain-containing protein
MSSKQKSSGFSLVEILLVLAIMGIISAIAIPAFIGQRERARLIGDARANSQVLRMQLEGLKADAGLYAPAGTYVWVGSTAPAASVLNVPFTAKKGVSLMKYSLLVENAGLTYQLSVLDPFKGSALIYKTDQNGTDLPLH